MWFEYDDDAGAIWLLCSYDLIDDGDVVALYGQVTWLTPCVLHVVIVSFRCCISFALTMTMTMTMALFGKATMEFRLNMPYLAIIMTTLVPHAYKWSRSHLHWCIIVMLFMMLTKDVTMYCDVCDTLIMNWCVMMNEIRSEILKYNHVCLYFYLLIIMLLFRLLWYLTPLLVDRYLLVTCR